MKLTNFSDYKASMYGCDMQNAIIIKKVEDKSARYQAQ